MSARVRLRCISLGAGVQSTTLALMAARRQIVPLPDCAIFADTQWEPRAVYEHLSWLFKQLPFPIYRVTAGNIRQDIVTKATTNSGRFAAIPFYTLTDGGKRGMGRRQCTREYKIEPITRMQRELAGLKFGERMPRNDTVEVWIGISTDEASRMKPGWRRWQVNRWPLIERRMSRDDCIWWLKANGYPIPPKSACIGCPFHNDEMWRDMRANRPDEWADAVEVDRLIRAGGTLRGMRAKQYMHASRQPLDQVDLSRNLGGGQLNLFNNECSGMCGV